MLTPATKFLVFTPYRASVLLGLRTTDEAVLAAALRRADRGQLARATGVHSTREGAEEHARREGPMFLLTPAGEVERIAREEPADIVAQRRDAELDRGAAERLRLHPEEREFTFSRAHRGL